jgi:type I restriction enzyme S subunit
VVRLGNYCRLFSGYAFKSSDFVDSGIMVVKIGNLQNGTIIIDKRTSYFPPQKVTRQIEKYRLYEGDVFIALTGATTGKIAVVPKEFEGSLLNHRVGKFEIFSRNLCRNFFRYLCLLDFFQKRIKENILQSAQGNISPRQIEQILIPLPPLPIQQKITQILKAVDDKIEAEEKKKEALQVFFKTMLHHLMTGKIRVKPLGEDYGS